MQAQAMVYIVDPDEAVSGALSSLLATYRIDVIAYADAESFLQAVRDGSIVDDGCLLLDLDLPGDSGLSLLQQLKSAERQLPVIALSKHADEDLRRQCMQAGATDLVYKPFVAAYLFTRLSDLVPCLDSLRGSAASTMALPDGTQVTFRMMHPEDAEIEQAFVTGLSEKSKYMRFFSPLKELSADMLWEFTHHSFPISYALIATIPLAGKEVQVGVARYAMTNTDGIAEFAVVVADEWHGFGIASQLMRGVTTAAAVGGIRSLEGVVLRDNLPMLTLMRNTGFTVLPDPEDGPSVVRVVKELRDNAKVVS